MKIKFLILFCLIWVLPGMIGSAYQAHAGKIRWYSFKDGVTAGKSQNKKMYIHFMTDWCHWCKVMEKNTFSNPEVIKYLNTNFIAIRVDTDQEKRLKKMFRINGVPENWFISGKGQGIGHSSGYIPPDQFIIILKSIIHNGDMPY